MQLIPQPWLETLQVELLKYQASGWVQLILALVKKEESVLIQSSIARLIKKKSLKALEKVSTREYRDRLKKTINPYESDNTSKIILEEIKRAIKDYSSMRKKFYDL